MSLVYFNFLRLKVLTKIYIGLLPATFPAHDTPSAHISDTFHSRHSPFGGHKRLHQGTFVTKHEKSLLWEFIASNKHAHCSASPRMHRHFLIRKPFRYWK